MPAMLAVTLLTVSLFFDTYLSRVDGFVLLTGLVIVMFWLTRLGIRSAANDPMKTEYEAEIPEHVSMSAAVLWHITNSGPEPLLVNGEAFVAHAGEVVELDTEVRRASRLWLGVNTNQNSSVLAHLPEAAACSSITHSVNNPELLFDNR